MERWPCGLRRTPGKCVGVKASRGFESLSLRHNLKGLILANSDIYWIDITFDWCVKFLSMLANLLGITYEEINIWLFLIIGPISLLISIFLNYYFYNKIKNFKKIIETQKQEISDINEVEVEEKKTDYLKISGIIIIIILILYFLELKN